jgi:hypothetical protein
MTAGVHAGPGRLFTFQTARPSLRAEQSIQVSAKIPDRFALTRLAMTLT